jgi:hypothetical protein
VRVESKARERALRIEGTKCGSMAHINYASEGAAMPALVAAVNCQAATCWLSRNVPLRWKRVLRRASAGCKFAIAISGRNGKLRLN